MFSLSFGKDKELYRLSVPISSIRTSISNKSQMIYILSNQGEEEQQRN